MKANELRLGNYVDNQIHGVGEVSALSGLTVLYSRNYNSLSVDSFYPIPLTEEWLLMFGFELVCDLVDDMKYFELKPFKYGICFDHDDIVFYRNIGISNEYTPLIYDEKTLQHVHQLQNLYFALTGEELTI